MTSHLSCLFVRAGLLLLLAVGTLLLPGCSRAPAKRGANHPGVGQPLMLIDLQPLTGAGAPIVNESLKGRVTLMNFWATWCPPCKIEFPHLAALAKKFSADQKFQYLSVNTNGELSGSERTNAVASFLLEQHADHPTWDDSSDITSKVLREQIAWNGNIPLTVVIDATGTVRGIWNGYDRGYEVEMETLVRELLNSP